MRVRLDLESIGLLLIYQALSDLNRRLRLRGMEVRDLLKGSRGKETAVCSTSAQIFLVMKRSAAGDEND